MDVFEKCGDTDLSQSISPFICGLCQTGFKCFDKFCLHLKSHDIAINKLFHVCKSASDSDGNLVTCTSCYGSFGTICQLHDHLEGQSYVYNNKKKFAYPLNSLCGFDNMRDECKEKDVNAKLSPLESEGNPNKDFYELLEDFRLRYRYTTGINDEGGCNDLSDNLELLQQSDMKIEPVYKKKRGRPRKMQSQIVLKQTFCKSNQIGRNRKSNLIKEKKTETRSILSLEKHVQIECLPVTSGQAKQKEDNNEMENSDKESTESTFSNHNHILSRKKIDDKSHSNVQESTRNCIDKSDAEQNALKDVSPDNQLTKIVPVADTGNDTNLPIITEVIKEEKGSVINCKRSVPKKEVSLAKLKKSLKKTKCERKKKYAEAEQNKSQSLETEKKKCGRKKLDLEVCTVCGKRVRRSKMKVHVISHSDVRAYQCDYCPKTYKYPEHLAVHVKSHSDVLPFYCEVCGQGFIDANRLKRHAIMHTDFRPYSCKECDAGFITRYKLDRHMFVHTGVKKMQCDLCGMRFAHKESLTQHISGIHIRERRFACGECDKTFFTNYQLKCHSMKHSGLRPHKCSMCKSDFIERKELRRHMRKQHNTSLDGKTESVVPEEAKADTSENSPSNSIHIGAAYNGTANSVFGGPLPNNRCELMGMDVYKQANVIGIPEQRKYLYEDTRLCKDGLTASSINSEDSTISSFDDNSKISQYGTIPFSQTINRLFSSSMFVETSKGNYVSAPHNDLGIKNPVPSLLNDIVHSEQSTGSLKHTEVGERTTFEHKNNMNKPSNVPSPDSCKNFLSL